MSEDVVSLSSAELLQELRAGGRIVQFQYCISVLIMTFTFHTHPRLVAPEERTLVAAFPWIAISLIAGWWGIPWGPIRTVTALGVNFSGGHDLTKRYRFGLEEYFRGKEV